MSDLYEIDFDGLKLNYQLRWPMSYYLFGSYMHAVSSLSNPCIVLTDELIETRKHVFAEEVTDSFLEYRLLAEPTGKLLSLQNRFLFHAVAFSWRGRGWLLTAPSGTGKTTQFQNWKRLWPDEVQLICGDMPLLHLCEDGSVRVCPSPWNGSERLGYGSSVCAPLGGIVYLEQGQNDSIQVGSIPELLIPLWHKCIGQADTVEQIRARASFLNQVLQNYPIWKLTNRGDDASARLTQCTIMDCLDKGGSTLDI